MTYEQPYLSPKLNRTGHEPTEGRPTFRAQVALDHTLCHGIDIQHAESDSSTSIRGWRGGKEMTSKALETDTSATRMTIPSGRVSKLHQPVAIPTPLSGTFAEPCFLV